MNPDTAKIIDRLVLSRDGLRKLDIADYAMIRDAREAMADAANALTNYAKTFSVIEQNDQAAAPHMLPAPEGVSEAEKALHDLCSWLDQWDRRDNDTAKNIRTVLSALSSERERAERAGKSEAETWDRMLAERSARMAENSRNHALEVRAQVAEAKVKAAEEALRPFLALARAVTVDGSPDFVSWAQEAKDWTVAFSFAGHSISLGDLRALAALRWTQGEGE